MKGHNQENGVQGYFSPQGKPQGHPKEPASERKSKPDDPRLSAFELLVGNSGTGKKPSKAKENIIERADRSPAEGSRFEAAEEETKTEQQREKGGNMFDNMFKAVISAAAQESIYSPIPGVDGLEVTPRSQVRPGSIPDTPDTGMAGAFKSPPGTRGAVRHGAAQHHTAGGGLAGEMDAEAQAKENLEAEEFKSRSRTPSHSSDPFHSAPSSPRGEAKGADLEWGGGVPREVRMEAHNLLGATHVPFENLERLQAIGKSAQERRRTQSGGQNIEHLREAGGAGGFAKHSSGESGSGGPIGSRTGARAPAQHFSGGGGGGGRGFFAKGPYSAPYSSVGSVGRAIPLFLAEEEGERIEKLNQGITEMIEAIKGRTDNFRVSDSIFVLENLAHGISGGIASEEHQRIQSFSLLQAIYHQRQGNKPEVRLKLTDFLISKLIEAGTNECNDPTFGKAINKIASKIKTKDLETFQTIAERLLEEPTWLEWIGQQIKQLLNVISKCWGGDLFAGSIAEYGVREELPKLLNSSCEVEFTKENAADAWSKFCEEKVNAEVMSRA